MSLLPRAADAFDSDNETSIYSVLLTHMKEDLKAINLIMVGYTQSIIAVMYLEMAVLHMVLS